MILFVSDGSPTDDKEVILRLISEQNARLRNTVHIQTFGIGEGNDIRSKTRFVLNYSKELSFPRHMILLEFDNIVNSILSLLEVYTFMHKTAG